MQKAQNFNPTIIQIALAKVEKNILKNMNNLKDEVLNLINIVLNLPGKNQKLCIKR